MSEQTKPANDPKDKPPEQLSKDDILEEFVTRLANDPWVDASVKQAAQAAHLRYYPKPRPEAQGAEAKQEEAK